MVGPNCSLESRLQLSGCRRVLETVSGQVYIDANTAFPAGNHVRTLETAVRG